MKRFIAAALLGLALFTNSARAFTTDEAVKAIVGEAANQGYEGMYAVACAIRNRGTLRGVLGRFGSVASKQRPGIWELARRAWAASEAGPDVTHGATHWENVKAFGMPCWAKSMTVTVVVRDHTFFRP